MVDQGESMGEELMQVEKEYLKTVLAPESRCEECLFKGMRCWTFKEEYAGHLFCEVLYAKLSRILGLEKPRSE